VNLVPAEAGSKRLLLVEDVEALHRFKLSKETLYALVGPLDSMVLLRRDLSQLMSPDTAKQKVYAEKGYCDMGGMSDLPSNAILKNGEVVGLWEYDPASAAIAWMPFSKPDTAMKQAVAQMEAFVRDQLGDSRSFSLDSPNSRIPKINALRKAQAAAASQSAAQGKTYG
jgi:hypothetical protein